MTMSKNEREQFNEAKDKAERFEDRYWKACKEIESLQNELRGLSQQALNQRLSDVGYKAQLDRALGWIDCKEGNLPGGIE